MMMFVMNYSYKWMPSGIATKAICPYLPALLVIPSGVLGPYLPKAA